MTQTAMHRFMGERFGDYRSLWRWSVEDRAAFWSQVWDFCGVIGDKGRDVYRDKFFPHSKINFAENLLRRRDDAVALIFSGEGKVERSLTYKELYDTVSRMRQALIAEGVVKGDRVAGYMPNAPETLIAMLATASLGAVWSSASPDFGVQGVLDRFGQIEPKVLFAADGYYYNKKWVDNTEKTREIAAKMPSLKKTVIVSFADGSTGGFAEAFKPADIKFERFDFNHPLYIMFSSGTTGIPKCIVHGAGGTLIQHLKEHQLHCDIKRGDRVFYYTTCGWMMWNWLVTALASEATLLLWDGSPFIPNGRALFTFAEKHKCTFFGASAKYIETLRNHEIDTKGMDLSSVRLMTSTGSPLAPEGFDYVGEHILPGVPLASISGGTDIVSCFVLGNPISPVYRGEIQGPGLGMDVDVFDDNGKSMPVGEKGELVCKQPFPSMPVGFWNDPDGSKYRKAYFEKFPGIWHHGDWCAWTEHGGFIIHGRSDATLNPGGVRIGTAEIYRLVEQMPEIKESVAVGQDWKGDVRVVLFVVMNEGFELNDDIIARLRKKIKDGASPRHVPTKVVAVADIPRTKSGKITELAVRDVIHGRVVKNVEALSNATALKCFEDIKELQS